MRRWIGDALGGAEPLAIVAALVIAFGAAELYAGATSVGVTTDEPTHVKRLAGWLDSGWYVPEANLRDGRPDPDDELANPYVYGPASALLAHGVNVAVGNEAGDEVAETGGAYRVRHLIVALIAALAALAAGVATWALTGSPRFALWTTAALLAIPAWIGHGFFNPKDTPAAAGYTLVTAALVLALRELPGEAGRARRTLFAIAALLAAGMFVGAGTRFSLWVPILASLVTYAGLRAGGHWLGGLRRGWAADVAVAAGTLAGLAAIAVAYPKVAASPFSLLVDSVTTSAGYPLTTVTLTAGQLLREHPPVWYLPAWIGAATPLLLAALAIGGALSGIRALARRGGGRWLHSVWSRPQLGIVLVLQQALLLPLASIAGNGVMYDGIRQHLYVLPAIAILAGFGAAALWRWASRPGSGRAARPAVLAGLSLALVLPMTEGALLFPYNYAYVSPVAGIGGVNGRWEADYWFASSPEALSHVPRGVRLRCSLNLIPAGAADETEPDLSPCGGEYFGPFASERGSDPVADPEPGAGATWVVGRSRGDNRPPPQCRRVGDVTRWLRGERVVMSYVLRCPS